MDIREFTTCRLRKAIRMADQGTGARTVGRLKN
jgi:hypothetical protein